MKKYIKIYIDYFGFGEQDYIPCEICKRKSVDIHHILPKSKGGKDLVNNLIALCRQCHINVHSEIGRAHV